MEQKPIIFFDGVCSLCNGFVNFLFEIKAHRFFNVASLQGKTAKNLLDENYLETIILYKDGKIFKRSEAIFQIIRKLSYPWKFLMIFSALPRFFTNGIYNYIAKNRYDLFGKKDICRMPTKEESQYFLD